MIDLERNSKKQLVDSKGKRTRESSIYKPNQKESFKISRGKFSDFLSCPRCFYLDRVKGLKPPGTPGWTLNETTDLLLKKEFDVCREKQIPHRLFSKFGLNDVVPFRHKDLDKWRNSLNAGLQVQYKNTNIILTGGIDDIWIDLNTNELIIVDYKSQAKTGVVGEKEYLEDPYHAGYKIQMDFYAYLLTHMGYKVKTTCYFLVCNADRGKSGFFGQMEFEEYLIPYKWNKNWIDKKVDQMIDLINQNDIPTPNKSCNNCAYSDQYAIALGRNIQNPSNNSIDSKNDNESYKAKVKISEINHSLEKLKNEKKILDNVLSNPKLLAEHVTNFYREDGPYPMKEYFKLQENTITKENLEIIKNSLKEYQSRSSSYAEILSEPELLKEYYSQFFSSKSSESNRNELNGLKSNSDFPKNPNVVISPVQISAPYLKETHFGVIVHRERNIYTVITACDIWMGDASAAEIYTTFDWEKHEVLDYPVLMDSLHEEYPELTKLQFKSDKNYILTMEDYLNIKSHSHQNSLADLYKEIFITQEKQNHFSRSIFNNSLVDKVNKYENNELSRIVEQWIKWGVLIRDIDNNLLNFGFILTSNSREFSILTDYSTFERVKNDNSDFGVNIQTFTNSELIKLKCIEHEAGEGASYPGFSIWSNYLEKNDIKHSELRNKFLYSCVLINKIGFGIIVKQNKNEYTVLTSLELLQKSIAFSYPSREMPYLQTLMDGLNHSINLDSLLEGIRTSVHQGFALLKFKAQYYDYPALGFD